MSKRSISLVVALILASAAPAGAQNSPSEAAVSTGRRGGHGGPPVQVARGGGGGRARETRAVPETENSGAKALDRESSGDDVDAIEKALADSDWYVRGEAALKVARQKKTVPLADLTPLLSDANWFVRSAALEAVASLGDPAAAPLIEHLLNPSDPYQCARAAAMLGQMKYAEAINPLIRLLSEGDDQVQRAAALALGSLKAAGATSELTGLLRSQSPEVKSAAAQALGEIGDKQAAAGIVAAIKEAAKQASTPGNDKPEAEQEDEPDRLTYAIALYRLGDHDGLETIGRALSNQYDDERNLALGVVSEQPDDRALPDIMKQISPKPVGNPETWPGFQVKIAHALGSYRGDQARNALIGMLSSEQPEIRAAAIEGLAAESKSSGGAAGGGTGQDDPAVPALVGLMKNERAPLVVQTLARSMDDLGREQLTDALLRAVNSSPNIRQFLSDLGITAASMSGRLNEGSVKDRVRAAEALGRLNESDAVPSLIQSLASAEPQVRAASATSLGVLRDRRAEDALIQASHDQNKQVRVAALGALGRLGDATVSEQLFQAARDQDPAVRQTALAALSGLGISVDRLSVGALNTSWQVRAEAMSSLAKLGDPRGVPILISGLKDSQEQVRVEAARGLAEAGNTSAVPALIASLGDSNGDVRAESALALGALGDRDAVSPLSRLLGDKDSRVSSAAAESLVKMRDPSAVSLVVAELDNSDWGIRARAAEILSRVPGAAASGGAVSSLVERLRDQDLVVRYYATEALVAIGGPSVPGVIDLLQSGRGDERERAARVLARIGNPSVEAVDGLLYMRETSAEVRAAAAGILGMIRDPKSTDALSELLGDPRMFVREQASMALGRIGGPAVDRLLVLAKSSTPSTREAAIGALGLAQATMTDAAANRAPEAGTAPLIPVIVEALRDSNPSVRAAAVRALGDTRRPEAIEPLMALMSDESGTLRGEASVAISKIGHAAIPALTGALDSPRTELRILAAQSLGDIRDRAAVPALIRVVSNDPSARGDAVEALGKIGDVTAVAPIIGVLQRGSIGVRQQAITALIQFADPRVQDALVASLDDRDEEIRQMAAAGLGEIGNSQAIPRLETAADNDPSSDVREAAAGAIERVQARIGKK